MKLEQCQGVKVRTPVLWAKVKTLGRMPAEENPAPQHLCSGRLPVALAFFSSPPPPCSPCLAFLPRFLSGRPTPAWGPCAWLVNGHLLLPRGGNSPTLSLPLPPQIQDLLDLVRGWGTAQSGGHSEPRNSDWVVLLLALRAPSHILPFLLHFLRGERCWLSLGEGWRVTSGVNTAC